MKQKLLKTMLLLSALVVGNSSTWGQVTIWSENFSGYSADAVPSGTISLPHTGTSLNASGTLTYTCTNGTYTDKGVQKTSTTKVYAEELAGGSSPELMVARTTGGSFSATVPLDNIEGTITLKYKQNAQSLKVTMTAGAATTNATNSSKAEQTVTLSGITADMTSVTILFETTGSKNVRLDDIALTGYKVDVAITSIAFSAPKTASIAVGETTTLTPTVLPANYTETIDWESDATGVATVSSTGVVTGVSAGTAHIKAKAHNNPSSIYDECTVTVTAPVAVTGVTLKSSTTIEVGKTETLVPTILPADATNKTVAWFSDDDTKVSVDDDGVITGLAVTGEDPVTITVMTEDGYFEAECAVTVIPKNTDVNLTSPISITTWPSLSYGDAAEYEVEGVCFTATQCMNSSGLQFKKSAGILASPLIKSTYGYTVIVTTNSAGTGTLTLQIGSETPVSISSGSSTTYIATTSSTSVGFTLTNSSGNACNIASLAIVPPISVTVGADSYATFACDFPLDFTDSDIKAYIAKGKADYSGVTFTQINKVPANTGVLLYKSGGTTENIPLFAGAADAATGNVFVRGTGATVASEDGDLHNYILNKVGGVVGFYKAAGQTVATNRAYIQIDQSKSYSVKEFIALPGMEDDADGIQTLSDSPLKGENIYNLAGQRLQKMQKGINIVNGKKVLF